MASRSSKKSSSSRGKNEGEGSRSADREYRERTRRFIESGRVEAAAREAERAVRGRQGKELARAEAKGRSRARG